MTVYLRVSVYRTCFQSSGCSIRICLRTFDPAVVIAASAKLQRIRSFSGNLHSVVTAGSTAVPLIGLIRYSRCSTAGCCNRINFDIRTVIIIPSVSSSSTFRFIHIFCSYRTLCITVCHTFHRRCELAQRVNHAAAQIRTVILDSHIQLTAVHFRIRVIRICGYQKLIQLLFCQTQSCLTARYTDVCLHC